MESKPMAAEPREFGAADLAVFRAIGPQMNAAGVAVIAIRQTAYLLGLSVDRLRSGLRHLEYLGVIRWHVWPGGECRIEFTAGE